MNFLYTFVISTLFTFALGLPNLAQAQSPISLGCFADSAKRDLDGFSFQHSEMTANMCISICKSKNFAFAGTQFSTWCMCGNSYGKQGTSNKCGTPCSGNKGEICGGAWANSVYSTTKDQPGQALGCFVDKQIRDLDGATNGDNSTGKTCVDFCKVRDFKYAGTQSGNQCFCGNSYGAYGSSSECSRPCKGNEQEKCGGTWANTIYSAGGSGSGGIWLPAIQSASAATQFGTSAGKPLYICRFEANPGEKHSGKAWNNTCYVGYAGKELSKPLAQTEILVADSAKWTSVSGDKLPEGTIISAIFNGGPVYICRAKVGNGELHPGKLWANNCYVGWAGKELQVANYEVLVAKSTFPIVATIPPPVITTQAAQTLAVAAKVDPYSPLTPENAKAKDGDPQEVTRMKKQLINCVTQVEDYKKRADYFKSALSSGKVKGLVESKPLAEEYDLAMTQYNAYKANDYPPNKDRRFNGFIQDHLNDCLGASDGFKNYEQNALIDNQRAFNEFEAANKKLTPAEEKIKPQLELCVVNLQLLQEDNNRYNEDSKKIFNTAGPQLNKFVGPVNDSINTFLKTSTVKYTDANLEACKKIATNTTVRDEFVRLGGLKRDTVLRDMSTEKAEAAAAEAARQKKAAEDAAAYKAQIEAAEKARAAAEAAEKNPQKIKECIDTVKERRAAIGRRYYDKANMEVAMQDNWRIPYESWTKEIDASINNYATSPTSRLSSCLAPWPELDDLERLVVKTEKISADNRQKKMEAELKAQEEARAKAKKEYEAWLKEHPTDIPAACDKSCTVRHAGPGPRQKNCARLCAIASTAIKDTVNYVVDQTVVAAADKALNTLGVTKALCEAATGTAGKILQAGQEQLDKLQSKIKDTSEEACRKASGTAERCRYVGRFLKFTSDLKACTDMASSLNKSLKSTQTKYANQEKLVNKSKNGGKVSKEEENALKEAAMDEGIQGASTCEAVQASDIIGAMLQPCTDAGLGTAWLISHSGDL